MTKKNQSNDLRILVDENSREVIGFHYKPRNWSHSKSRGNIVNKLKFIYTRIGVPKI